MDFSRFDKYYRYLIAVPLLIALLTYWRFREINFAEVYAYVARQDVIHPMLQQSFTGPRSIVWDFFGLLNRILIPGSIIVLRLVGFLLTVLNYFLLSKLLNDILGQRFWGFLGAFLVSLSPFMVVAAVAGVPSASSATVVILFLMAIYKNEYVFGGILSGVAVAANLPGLIMFLIMVLDLLQNSTDSRPKGDEPREQEKIVQRVLYSAAGFFGVVLVVFIYSFFSGAVRFSPIPLQEQDVPWSLLGIAPIFVVNIVDVAGVVYLLVARRYDVYRTHFHSLMLWIASGALCVVQPTATNFLVDLVVSSLLAVCFIQGFASTWGIKFLSADTFVFLFVVLFLFADIYANNKYLQDRVLKECQQTSQELDEVVASIIPVEGNSQIVSNFVPSELSVKLKKPVVEIEGQPFPIGNMNVRGARTIFVVDKISRTDSLYVGCKLLLNSACEINGADHYIEVIQCEENSR
jgi:hypothetical protein